MEAIGNRFATLDIALALVLSLIASPIQAQYTDNFQTNIISGVTSNWVDDPSNPNAGYVVGSNWVYDALLINGGGALSNGFTSVGFGNGDSTDTRFATVIVSDSGSVWNNSGDLAVGNGAGGNTIIVTNGGVVNNNNAYVGNSGANNTVLVTGSGSVWNNSGALNVGWGNDIVGGGNTLTVSHGGAVYSATGTVEVNGGYGNNVSVTDTGSVWRIGSSLSMGNGLSQYGGSLNISNGGAIYCGGVVLDEAAVTITGHGSALHAGGLGLGTRGSVGSTTLMIADGGVLYSNGGALEGAVDVPSVNVTGPGSMWYNSGDFSMAGDSDATGGSMRISNGARVFNVNAYLADAYPNPNQVSVAGAGSLWDNSGGIYMRGDIGRVHITITDNGLVLASSLFLGNNLEYHPSLHEDYEVNVTGGALYVTNGLGTGVLDVQGGTLTLDSGTIVADQVVALNGPTNSAISFNGGLLSTKATTINNGTVFSVGDGSDSATLNLATGGSGFHSFANGLTISSNATLNGVGTIIGATTIKAGATLVPGDAPGSITFSNSLTLAAGSTFAVALNGAAPGQYDQITGLGTINISNAVLRVSLGYTPSPGDSYTIISNFSGMAVLGTFVTTDGLALPNGADFIVNGTTFQIDYAANANGMDVTLLAMIPEPSTCFLVAIGMTAVFHLRRRRRDHASSRPKSV